MSVGFEFGAVLFAKVGIGIEGGGAGAIDFEEVGGIQFGGSLGEDGLVGREEGGVFSDGVGGAGGVGEGEMGGGSRLEGGELVFDVTGDVGGGVFDEVAHLGIALGLVMPRLGDGERRGRNR